MAIRPCLVKRQWSRVWDFGDQSVNVTTIENAGDLGTLPAWVDDSFQVWKILELVSDFGIGESADHVLAIEQSTEELASSRASGLKAFADRFGASCLRVVTRSKVRIASVGLSHATGFAYRLLTESPMTLFT